MIIGRAIISWKRAIIGSQIARLLARRQEQAIIAHEISVKLLEELPEGKEAVTGE